MLRRAETQNKKFKKVPYYVHTKDRLDELKTYVEGAANHGTRSVVHVFYNAALNIKFLTSVTFVVWFTFTFST